MLEELHSAHSGVAHTKAYARCYVWWPHLDADIESMTRGCQSCQENQRTPPHVPMNPWQWSTRPWERIHIDHLGPFMGHTMLLVIDSHSKWIEVFRVSSTSSAATIAKLRTLFAVHGLPHTLVSDNGTGFTSSEFEEFLSKNGVKHVFSPPHHPSSNGLAERAVQTVKNGLKKQRSGDIQCKIDRFLFKYRSTPQSTTGHSPAELLLGRRPRHRLDQIRPSIESRVFGKQHHQANAKNSKYSRTFEPGDPVYVLSQGAGSPWISAFVVSVKDQIVTVISESGVKLTRHVDHVTRRYNVEMNTPSQTPVISDDLFKRNIPVIPVKQPLPSVVTEPASISVDTDSPVDKQASEVQNDKSEGVHTRRSARVPKPRERLIEVCSLYEDVTF